MSLLEVLKDLWLKPRSIDDTINQLISEDFREAFINELNIRLRHVETEGSQKQTDQVRVALDRVRQR